MLKDESARQVKIDLQVKRFKDHPSSPFQPSKVQMGTTKSTNKSRKLNITIHNKLHNNSKATIIAPPQKIVISEFKLREEPSKIYNNILIQPSLHVQKKENKQSNDTSRQHQQELIREQQQKKQLLAVLGQKESQIKFYQHLLQQKTDQYTQEKDELQGYYERYVNKLIDNYQLEVDKIQSLTKLVEQAQTEKQLRSKRQIINLQGKMGLNFSPKQLSTFSGMSGNSILFESFQKEGGEIRRNQLFSFGSSKKPQARSQQKQYSVASFLNPGRNLLKGKRIAFD